MYLTARYIADFIFDKIIIAHITYKYKEVPLLNIHILRSASELGYTTHRKEKRGLLSYYARGNTLMCEKLSPEITADVLVISSDGADIHITPSIYDECRRRACRSVFLDANEQNRSCAGTLGEISASLSRRGVSVFCPLAAAAACPDATPVAECSVSGGELSEYISYLLRAHGRIALSIPRRCTEFSMPVFSSAGRDLSVRELRNLRDRYGAPCFFSPQLVSNYFIYSSGPDTAGFVLFDDARTISEKIRLARRSGIENVFLAYREISDIFEDIMF